MEDWRLRTTKSERVADGALKGTTITLLGICILVIATLPLVWLFGQQYALWVSATAVVALLAMVAALLLTVLVEAVTRW